MIDKDVAELVNIFRTTDELEKALDKGMPVFLIKYLEDDLAASYKLSSILEEGDYGRQLHQAFGQIEEAYPFLRGLEIDWEEYDQSIGMIYQFIDYVAGLTYTKAQWQRFLNNYMEQVSSQLGRKAQMVCDLTPESINELVIGLLKPTGTFYDGTLGIGRTAATAYQANQAIKIYGQEWNTQMTTWAKIYLFMQGVEKAQIENGNTLENPVFVENGQLQKFDSVFMNFPFTMQLHSTDFIEEDPYNRFSYGKLSKKSADYAFILHGLASLNDHGKAAFIVPSGVLFRGGMEEKIRAQLIQEDVIEAVITLPERLFYHTGIQTNLLILNKNKSPKLKNHIYFINAERLYRINRGLAVMEETHIERILAAYEQLEEKSGFAKLLPIDAVEGANLLCQKYIFDPVIEDPLFGKREILMDQFQQKAHTVKLDQVAKMYRGLNITPSSFEEAEGPYKILKLSDVQDGQIQVDQLASGKLLRKSKVERYLVEAGDVIISNRGASIKIAVIPKTDERILLTHNFIGLRLADKVNPHYVKGYLESPLGQFLLHQIQNGTAVLTINAKDLASIDIVLPAPEEQDKIAAQFAKMEVEYEARLKELQQFKRDQTSSIYEAMGIEEFMK